MRALSLCVLLLACAAPGCRRHTRSVERPNPPVVRELGASTDSAFDRSIEIVLDGRAKGASLLVFDEGGRSLAAPIPFDEGRDRTLRAVVPRRALLPYRGRARGVVLVGDAVRVRALARTLEGKPREALASVDVRASAIDIDAAPPGTAFDPAALARSEGELASDPGRALATLDAMRGDVEGERAADVDAVAAEAAFAYGRARLGAAIAARGLTVAKEPRTRARMLRVMALAEIEESVSKDTPAARARLGAEPRAGDLEAALDAALDLRVAEVHDRTFPLDKHAPPAAKAFLAAFERLEQERPLFGAMLCRAARALADGSHHDPANALLERGATLAHASGRLADEVMCAIKAGDVARMFGRLGDAEGHYTHARELLGERPLPREQREASFSAALLAESRGDHREALRLALVACRFIDRLLGVESDLVAREALVANVLGYYGVAELFAARAGEHALAIAIGEAGKGRAFGALLSGPSGVDATASAAWVATRELAPEDDASSIAARGTALGEADAILSFMQVGTNAKGELQHAVGIITREGVTVRITTHSKSFLADVVAHGEAVERNDETAARTLGARIYDELLRPTEDLWANKTRLLVSPNRRLQSLSYAALHDGTRWLAERAAIARLPPLTASTRTPADDALRLGALRWMFVLDPTHPSMERLPGLRAVASQLAARVHPVATLTGPDGTRDAIFGHAAAADALLYAGHAKYDGERPLQSALLIAPSPRDPEGKLAAWSTLGIAHAPKVVLLVGCETATLWKGKASFSDDFIGLSRAFLAAGARDVVGALWPVVDRDAEDFLRAVFTETSDVDVVRSVGRAQACMAAGRCVSRGVAAWGSYVVDTR